MSFHSHTRTADLLDRFSTDFAAIESMVAHAIPCGILPALEAILTTALMLWLNWYAGLVGLLFWPWIVLTPRIPAVRVVRANEARREDEMRVLGALKENLTAQAIVRAFSLEQKGIASFRKRNDRLSRSTMRAGLLSAFMERFTGTGILGIQTFLLALSAWLAFEKQMTLGTLVALQMLAVVLSNALLFIVEFVPSFWLGRAAFAPHRRVASSAARH